MNTFRTFQVCAKTDCSRFDQVGARVRALKTKVAIYVDTLAPAGGLDSTALDSIANTFDQRLYTIDTAAFGRESDIDSNSVVLVLMTNTVNKLVNDVERFLFVDVAVPWVERQCIRSRRILGGVADPNAHAVRRARTPRWF